jgi:hypothetical protein
MDHCSQGRRAFVAASLAAIVIWAVITVPDTTNKVDADALTSAVATTIAQPSPQLTTTTTSTTLVQPKPVVSSLYYLGDSVAYDMWPAIEAELNAANVTVHSGAFGGVGIVPTDVNTTPLQSLATELDLHNVDLLILQLSVWDAQQDDSKQQAALDDLVTFVADRNLRLVFVSFPSIAADRSEPGQISLEDKARAIAANQMARSSTLINVRFSVMFSFVTLMEMATQNASVMASMCAPLVHSDRRNGSFKNYRPVLRASLRPLTTLGSLAIGPKTVVTTVRQGLVLPYN